MLELLWDNFDILRQPLSGPDEYETTIPRSSIRNHDELRYNSELNVTNVYVINVTVVSPSWILSHKNTKLKKQKQQQRFRTTEKSDINPVLSEHERLKANTSEW